MEHQRGREREELSASDQLENAAMVVGELPGSFSYLWITSGIFTFGTVDNVNKKLPKEYNCTVLGCSLEWLSSVADRLEVSFRT